MHSPAFDLQRERLERERASLVVPAFCYCAVRALAHGLLNLDITALYRIRLSASLQAYSTYLIRYIHVLACCKSRSGQLKHYSLPTSR